MKICRAALLCFVIAISPISQGQETTNTASIIQSGLNFSCMDWQPIGVCFWLRCTIAGCDVETSLKVRHFIPDAVVSSYSNVGENPWTEVSRFSRATSFAQEGGTNSEGSSDGAETALLFKNVDIIGSPANLIYEALSGDYFCDPGATFYFPYFISTYDPFWRMELIESALGIRYVTRRVAEGRSEWAPLYPRIGFVGNGHDYKAGAVAAQRAANIATQGRQPHVYWNMAWGRGSGYWPPGTAIEGDEETHKWQQLIPADQSNTCMVFPDQDDTGSLLSDPFAERLNQSDGYSFHLWRPYECCDRRGAYITSVDWQ